MFDNNAAFSRCPLRSCYYWKRTSFFFLWMHASCRFISVLPWIRAQRRTITPFKRVFFFPSPGRSASLQVLSNQQTEKREENQSVLQNIPGIMSNFWWWLVSAHRTPHVSLLSMFRISNGVIINIPIPEVTLLVSVLMRCSVLNQQWQNFICCCTRHFNPKTDF